MIYEKGEQMKNQKKSICISLALFLSIGLSTPCWATMNCQEEYGYPFQGTNGKSYCISKVTMNWWSAFSWCKNIGGKLATHSEACPGTGSSRFSNLSKAPSNLGYVHTATLHSTKNSRLVRINDLSGGASNPVTTSYLALCIDLPASE